MLHVCLYGNAESLFRALHEVASATAMHVHLNAARNYIATLGIYDFCIYDVEITV